MSETKSKKTYDLPSTDKVQEELGSVDISAQPDEGASKTQETDVTLC